MPHVSPSGLSRPFARHRMARPRRSVLLAGAVGLCLGVVAARPASAQEMDQTDNALPPSGPPALPAPTDTVLPHTGFDTSAQADLRAQLLSAYGQTPPPGSPASAGEEPGLHVLKQIGVSETYTDNAGFSFGGAPGSGSDFITAIQPAVRVIDNSQRLLVDLDYSPTGLIYARHSNYSQFEQQFLGDILATVVPGWLYLDLRGTVSEQAVFGGLGPFETVYLAPDQRETVSSVSVSPYLSHTFGGTGTLVAGVGYSYSAVDAPSGVNQSFGLPGSGIANYGSSYLNTERVFASFTTGENYGRFRDRLGTDQYYYQGSGALSRAHRILVTDDASYAFTRLISGLAEIGYEDLSYPSADFSYRGPIGAVGVQLTPGPRSTIIAEYRWVDGFGSAYLQASVQATPRIRIFGGYSEGISTFQQDLQDSLLSADTFSSGAAASALIAAPLLLSSNFYGANEYLSRERRIDANATYLGLRDTVTLSVGDERTTPVGRPIGNLTPVTTDNLYVSASERHQITPTLSGSLFAQWGRSQIGVAGTSSGETVSFDVSLDKLFTPTVTGYARVGGTYVVGGSAFDVTGLANSRTEETHVTVGGVKRF